MNVFQVGQWSHSLFGCFDDCGICIIAYFVPCVTFGQNAEAIGEGSCVMCGKSMSFERHRLSDSCVNKQSYISPVLILTDMDNSYLLT